MPLGLNEKGGWLNVFPKFQLDWSKIAAVRAVEGMRCGLENTQLLG
jgi:hypothetical protein